MNENLEASEVLSTASAESFKDTITVVSKLYLATIIATFAIAIGGIVCAVIYRVSLGFLIVLLSIIAYAAATINILYIKLGISYRMFHGCITITDLYGKNREIIYIPSKIFFCTVTEIGNRAFIHESSKNIHEIHLPKTLMRIGSDAFGKLPELTDVYYEGSEEEWQTLSRLAPLDEKVTVHFEAVLPMPEKKNKIKKKKSTKAEND